MRLSPLPWGEVGAQRRVRGYGLTIDRNPSSQPSPIEVGYIRLRHLGMPNSGRPELGGKGGAPPLRRCRRMRTKTSDAKLTNLFLDMLAAEQGAGDNTLDAYRRDLTDFSEFLPRGGQSFASPETQAMRDFLADCV